MPTTPTRCALALLLPLSPLLGWAETTAQDLPGAINRFGWTLYQQEARSAADKNLLFSPYSIASALAMTYPGARGETQAELQQVLQLPGEADAAGASYQALNRQLAGIVTDMAGQTKPIVLDLANRLYVDQSLPLQPAFTRIVQSRFDAAVLQVDFGLATQARASINSWVARQTHDRILNLLPEGTPGPKTKLILVNAFYLKAPWAEPFPVKRTRPEPFRLRGFMPLNVATMSANHEFGYAQRTGYTVITIPYQGGALQFVILLPDQPQGLGQLEKTLQPEDLTSCREISSRKITLYLPKLKLAPETMQLTEALKALGLKTAFDDPKGSANFDGMVPREPDKYLKIDEVFHKTWLALDEYSTEAAAATAVSMSMEVTAMRPVEVRVDHPFLFAIQHVPTGTCLFLGRVTDPR